MSVNGLVEGRMIQVKRWEEIRVAYHNEGKSIREIMRESGHSYRTIKRMVEGSETRKYEKKAERRAPVLGKYREQIEGMVKESEKMPSSEIDMNFQQTYSPHTWG